MSTEKVHSDPLAPINPKNVDRYSYLISIYILGVNNHCGPSQLTLGVTMGLSDGRTWRSPFNPTSSLGLLHPCSTWEKSLSWLKRLGGFTSLMSSCTYLVIHCTCQYALTRYYFPSNIQAAYCNVALFTVPRIQKHTQARGASGAMPGVAEASKATCIYSFPNIHCTKEVSGVLHIYSCEVGMLMLRGTHT